MKQLFVNRKIKLFILVGIIFILTFGVTYAYFVSVLDVNEEPNQMVTETGTLELNYIDGDHVESINIRPGWTANKTIVVTNIGSLDAYYKIFWKELTNTIERDELVLSAICTSYENYGEESQVISGSCNDINETPIPYIASSIEENIGIESGITHVYYFTFKFKEMSSLQNYNQGKRFGGVINVDDSYGLYTMNGVLLNAQGLAMSNKTIRLHREPRETVTDAEGKFTFENVPEGNHTITIVEENIENNMILKTALNVGSSGTLITSNIDNKVLNLTIKLNENSLVYDVESATNFDLNVVAIYVDGIKVSSLDNTKHYDLISSACSNGENISWKDETKSLIITPLSSSTKCTVNFNGRTINNLKDQILADNEEKSDSSIDFSLASSSTNGQGLYYTSDLTKTENGEKVYYFRGNVDNNYVLFAGFCFKIIRTNEDGSIKLMYWSQENDNTCSTTSSMPTDLTGKKFNSEHSDNRYVGYMYGVNCNDYTSCHTNTTNSTIKGLIDSWYNSNIVSQGNTITSKVANTKYCNDRTVGNGGTVNDTLYGMTGYGTNATLYGAVRRIGTGGVTGTDWSSTNASPQYDCPNDARDAFTLSIAAGGISNFGNNALDYPVALLTADEIVYAGGAYGQANSSYFLYTGNYYWTMSPFNYNGTYNGEWGESGSGRISNYYVNDTTRGAYPVISLKSTAYVSEGDGHASTPYVIE